MYCCGPAPVRAILEGQTDLKYDVPFVYAEVNADCIDWLVSEQIFSLLSIILITFIQGRSFLVQISINKLLRFALPTFLFVQQVKADGSKTKIWSDTKKVGHSISTKSVGSNKRVTLTDTYKYKEGEFTYKQITYTLPLCGSQLWLQ